MATDGYCVKCKTKRTMKDDRKITMKNGKPATQGTCPVCGTKMFKIGGRASARRPIHFRPVESVRACP
jgi:RNase P subunit RPR2